MADIAFLGTGTMGQAMARNLLKAGFSLRAWNRTAQRAEPLADDGAEVCQDPREAADGCSVVITMLSDGDAVLATAQQALGDDTGQTWVQMSTIGIDATERCAVLAAERGATFVDAPVLGTRDPAREGKLIVLASGPDDAREHLTPIFDAVGARTQWAGEAGAGSRLKVVVNGWLVGTLAVLAETVSSARALGVDPEAFFAAIKGGPLDMDYAQLKGAAMVAEDFGDVSFRLALSRKDGELLLDAALPTGVQLPVLKAVVARLKQAEADGHGDEDLAATYRVGPHPNQED